MPQSLSKILVHLIFSTKHREPYLTPEIRPQLFSYLGGILNQSDCPNLALGGHLDHVHLLFGLGRNVAISQIVATLKISSTKWLKTQHSLPKTFQWQSGYGAFSVSQSKAQSVIEYIQNQEDHHRKVTFQEEYRNFCKRYEILLDERYAWD